ncbi:hypothetical protein BU15DRAFT_77337 [Melanogaster broomeanus]|nr:hypothetical protein BU15DRAFT_77337 [Melanogaster broomeanus]
MTPMTSPPTTPGTPLPASGTTVTPSPTSNRLGDFFRNLGRMVLAFLAAVVPFTLSLIGCPFHPDGCGGDHYGLTICGSMALLGVLLSFGAASLFTLGLVKVPGGYRVSYWVCVASALWGVDSIIKGLTCNAELGGTVPYFIRGLAGGAVVAVLRYVYHAGKVHQTSSPDIESGHSTTLSEHLQVLNEHLQALIKKLVKQAFKFVFRLDVKEDNGVEICKSLKSLSSSISKETEMESVVKDFKEGTTLHTNHLLVTYLHRPLVQSYNALPQDLNIVASFLITFLSPTSPIASGFGHNRLLSP